MSALDVAGLLQEMSPELPCGENLEYDPQFVELESLVREKPEQEFGDTLVPGEEPNWKSIRTAALELIERSRDLRVAIHLLRALTKSDGLEGLRDCLALIRGLVEQRWDAVHPQLDPEDDNDPTMRVNVLEGLADSSTTIRHIRNVPLVSATGLGPFTLRDILVAKGDMAPPANSQKPPPNMADIDGAFMAADLEGLQSAHDAASEAIDHTMEIENHVTNQVGADKAMSLRPLVDALREAQQILAGQLERRGVAGVSVEDAEVERGEGAGGISLTGQFTSREEVIFALDKACDYFTRYEPSSPIPLLLKRAKRLVSQDFMSIMKDLAPDGVSQVEMIGGVSADENIED